MKAWQKSEDSMISVEEAYFIIASQSLDLGSEVVGLHSALGRVLAESIHADTDLPSFDRVMMDGVALSCIELQSGTKNFKIQDIQRAGIAPIRLEDNASCIEIMTGSIMSLGADTVIPYEEVEIRDGYCTVLSTSFKVGQHIHRKGSDAKKGDCLIRSHARIGPAEIGISASLGMTEVSVIQLPRIAIVSTGDELIEINETPQPWQIRRSNVYALEAMIHEMGHTSSLHHLHDNKVEMTDMLESIITNHDLVLLSGGVSKGKLDLLPEVMTELGVQTLFHRIAQKPGKPFFFGKKGSALIFGFPGNPISTFLCAQRYFVPWYCNVVLKQKPQESWAVLKEDFPLKGSLTYFLQVKLLNENDGRSYAYPIAGNGSGDFGNLAQADGFIEIPEGRTEAKSGQLFRVFRYRY